MADLPNNKEELPREHYAELFAALDAQDVTARTGVALQDGAFELDFLAHRLTAAYPAFDLIAEPPSKALTSHAARILVQRYLIRSTLTPWQGTFKSYRELPWGEVYDANFNGRCRMRLARTYGKNLDGFREAAQKLGGIAVKLGDAAYDVPLPGGITVRVIIHEGDEEFPAAAQFLFSDNISSAWDAEDLAVLGEVIITALKEV